MKMFLILIYTVMAVLNKISFSSADEFDLYTDIVLMRDAFKDAFSTMGNSIISMGRLISFRWLSSGNYLFNFSFALSYQDAEYFFYKEQKARDRKVDLMKKRLKRKMTYFEKEFVNGDEGKKYEYYCEDTDPEKLTNYCLWALRNKNLSKKLQMRLDDTEEPGCEFRFVHLGRYNYTTWRTFLRCPVLIKQEKKPERMSNMYISSVENAPYNRLLFYLFMLSPDADETSQSQSESQSFEYQPPRKSTGSVYDLDERDRSRVHDVQPSRKSMGSINKDVESVRDDLNRGSEFDEADSSKVASRRRHKFKETKPTATDLTSVEKDTSEGRETGRAASKVRQKIEIHEKKIIENRPEPVRKNVSGTVTSHTPTRRLSVRDYGEESPVSRADAKFARAAKSNINEYQLSRSNTRARSDYQSRRASLPLRNYTYDKKGRLVQMVAQENLNEPGTIALEIVTLLINKRHTLET